MLPLPGQQLFHIALRGEGDQVIDALTHADEPHGQAQPLLDRHDTAALGGAVQLGQDDAGGIRGLTELPRLADGVLLVLDAITGQNAISQAEEFCKAANATGVVLTKLDGTPRGGCAVSVWENLGLPIRFIGVGEKIDDLMEFDAQTFVESLLPESALQKDEKKEEGESEA